MTVKVKVKADGYKKFRDRLDAPATKKRVGDLIVDEIKASLKSGVSPVRGVRRFERYKNPDKYPGDQKPRTPVNLKLSGDMLDALEYFFKGSKLFVGIKDVTQAEKASYHQEGTQNMAQRKFLPTEVGDEFTVTIKRKIVALYQKLLSDIIRSR